MLQNILKNIQTCLSSLSYSVYYAISADDVLKSVCKWVCASTFSQIMMFIVTGRQRKLLQNSSII